MGHLRDKYDQDYFLGGIDKETKRPYGVLGHEEFRSGSIHPRLKQEFDFVHSFVASFEGKKVLDIGFGRGDYISLFLENKVKNYRGIDFSPAAVEMGKRRFKDPRVRFDLCEARDLREDETFDIILMLDIIEHIPSFEMEVIWLRLKKILGDGGFIVFSTPIFNDPNNSDHADLTFSEMGMHCHKQTMGSIIRACINHGFIIGDSNERCFGLFRESDLGSLSQERRARFIGHYEGLLSSHGLKYQDQYSDEDMRRLVPGAGRLLIGCVAENTSKYQGQVLRLIQSIRWFGGSMAGANIMVCIVDEADADFVDAVNKWGAFARIVPRFSYFHAHSNKLRLFDVPEIYAYDTVILLDCDTVVVQDLLLHINGETFQAKIADAATISHTVFERLFYYYNLPIPQQDYRCTFSGERTIWYCNAGVLIFPQSILRSLVPLWRKYTEDLARKLDLLGNAATYCEQASLALAYTENAIPFAPLSSAMNFPLHLSGPNCPQEMRDCDPFIIHYHHLIDNEGYIMDSSFPQVQQRIQAYNNRYQNSLSSMQDVDQPRNRRFNILSVFNNLRKKNHSSSF